MDPRIHLHPTAPLAERVLLPGDPGRALLLAQELLSEPKMFNHNRGLWGYTGSAVDRELLTIQSTGMGGPSAAIVITELAELGARRMIRVGTCGALVPELELGALLAASAAISCDGTSRALGAGARAAAAPDLVRALSAAGALGPGLVVSTDLFYDEREQPQRRWIKAGARAVDMETSTVFALAQQRGLVAASLLLVSDLLIPYRVRIEPDRLRQAERRMGHIALQALARSRQHTQAT